MQWKIKETLLPSKLDNLLYLLVGFTITLMGNFGYFAERLAGDSLYISENLRQAAELYGQQIINFIDNLGFAPASAIFIFWSLAGVLSFSILQAFISVGSEVKNDIDITTHYLHPQHYAKWSFLVEIIVQGFAHLIIYIVGITVCVLVGTVLAPVAISLLQSLALSFTLELLFVYIASLVLLWFGILLVATTVRLLLMRKHVQT